MVVTVDQIKDEGLTLHERLSQEQLSAALAEGQDTGFRAGGPTELTATFQKVSGGVLLSGSFPLRLTTPCARCLSDVQLQVPIRFTLNLVPESQVASDEEGEAADKEAADDAGSFRMDDADREVFDGKTIDLDPIIREQVLLALPMHALCREECKGLCGMCGQNLNEAQCGCEQKRVDPRLAALKNIKLN